MNYTTDVGTQDRLWRKNRNPNPGLTCFGVDANRNFPLGFDGSGSSNTACSESKLESHFLV